MLSFMVLVRVLNPTQFGYWVFFLGVYTLLDMLRSGLLGGAAVKFYTSDETEENLNQIEKSVLQLAFKLSFVSFLAPLVYYLFDWGIESSDIEVLALGIVPLSFISSFSVVATWFSQAKQNFKAIFQIRMLSQVTFLLLVLVGWYLEFGLVEIFYAYLFSNILSTSVVLLTQRVKLNDLVGRSKAWEKKLFSFGKYSMGTILGSNLLRNSDTYLLMGLLNATSVAIYNVPGRIMALLDIPIQAFSSADYPRLVDWAKREKWVELQNAFNKGIGLSILVVWPAAILVFAFADFVVWVIAGSQYENSVLILRIFAVFAMLLPLDRYAGMMLDALGIPKKNMTKMWIMLSANIIFDVLVLKLGYGVNAVAMVSIATYAIGVGLGFFYLKGRVQLQILKSVASAFQLILLKVRR